jgi:hypothetical protein
MAVCGRRSEDIYGVHGSEYVKLEECGMLGRGGGINQYKFLGIIIRVALNVAGAFDISDISGCEW